MHLPSSAPKLNRSIITGVVLTKPRSVSVVSTHRREITMPLFEDTITITHNKQINK